MVENGKQKREAANWVAIAAQIAHIEEHLLSIRRRLTSLQRAVKKELDKGR